jgi:hypothetical protein
MLIYFIPPKSFLHMEISLLVIIKVSSILMEGIIMADADKFMQEEFMPFYKRTFNTFKQNHNALYSVIEKFLPEKKNHIGIRIMENERTVAEYTVYFNGAAISTIPSTYLSHAQIIIDDKFFTA